MEGNKKEEGRSTEAWVDLCLVSGPSPRLRVQVPPVASLLKGKEATRGGVMEA